MGLDSTIVDNDSQLSGLESDDALPGTAEGSQEEEETAEELDLDGVYEATAAFYIDVDAIDGSSGETFATDTCRGDLTVEIDLDLEPSVFGRGDCILENFGIEGRGELEGYVDPITGEIDGWIKLTLDTEPVEVSWSGQANGDMVVGEFEGSLPFSDTNYDLDLDYLGAFDAER
jgi:hypothetical protein